MTGHRKVVVTSAIAVAVAAAFLTGSGRGASATAARGLQLAIPGGLTEAIHARFGAAPIRLASGGSDHPSFGLSVTLSADGTTALVSAYGVNKVKGAAYIYHVSDAGSWASNSTPAATLTGKPGTRLFGLGVALSADGTTAFVGAPISDGSGDGAVDVFHVSDEGAWTSTSTPTATLTASGDVLVGVSVAVSPDGTTVVAGAPFRGESTRAAYVFHVASEDTWASTSTPTAILSYSGEFPSNRVYGPAVAISADGTTALLGDAESGNYAGAAYLFHVASETAWASTSTPTAILTKANGVAKDLFAGSLALSSDGTTTFVGAPFVNGHTGEVDVFQAAGEGAWATSSTPAAVLTNATGAKNDAFGENVAVSSDGSTAVVTAPDVHHETGAAYVFHVADAGAWTSSAAPTATLTDSAGVHNDLLGVGLGVSADGATVLLGAPWVNWKTGAADVFHVSDASSWLTSSTPLATLTNSALPKPRCVVPRLKGAPLSAVKFVLTYENCRLGKVRRVHSTRRNRRHVVSQSPNPGRNLPPGSKVNVKIGK